MTSGGVRSDLNWGGIWPRAWASLMPVTSRNFLFANCTRPVESVIRMETGLCATAREKTWRDSSIWWRTKAVPIPEAATRRISCSVRDQVRPRWQSSKPMKPQNSPWMKTGTARMERMSWAWRSSCSLSGKSSTKPLTAFPELRSLNQRV